MKLIAEFKECPDCKVDARLMNSIVEEEIAKGNMGVDVLPGTQISLHSNIDPRRPPIAGGRVLGARVIRDICTKCGREFITRIETGYITIPTRQGVSPTFS